MSKQTKEEKREEERRIIAEMEAALRENEAGENAQNSQSESENKTKTSGESAPQNSPAKNSKKGKKGFHCPRCKTLLQEDGRCPTCGYKMYIPMDEKKRNKIKLILTAVLMAIFVVLFVILQFRK